MIEIDRLTIMIDSQSAIVHLHGDQLRFIQFRDELVASFVHPELQQHANSRGGSGAKRRLRRNERVDAKGGWLRPSSPNLYFADPPIISRHMRSTRSIRPKSNTSPILPFLLLLPPPMSPIPWLPSLIDQQHQRMLWSNFGGVIDDHGKLCRR
jgi:hypothetical protein